MAVTFALMVAPLVGFAGAAIDYSRSTSERAKLDNVVDAEALDAVT